MRAHEATIGVSCIQLPQGPTEAHGPTAAHERRASGFRLAVINCFNLEVGIRVRTDLAREFGLPAENYRRRISSVSRPARSLRV